MRSFKWGHSFFSLNTDALDAYSDDGMTEKDILRVMREQESLRSQKQSVSWKQLLPDDEEDDDEEDDE